MILAGAGCRACSVTRPPISPITREKACKQTPTTLLHSSPPPTPIAPPHTQCRAPTIPYTQHISTNPMLRNVLRRSNLSPSAARITPFICHFCARQPPLLRHLSITLTVCKSRAGKRDVIPASDVASDTVLTELRKDIKESVAHKNEEKESRRWKKKSNNDTEPSTSEAADKARNERQRRRKEKAKSDKAKRKEGTDPEINREKVKRGREKVKVKVKVKAKVKAKAKREGLSQAVSVRRVAGSVPVSSGVTPKEMGGVSLAAALKKRPNDKDMLTMDPGSDGVERTYLLATPSLSYSVQEC